MSPGRASRFDRRVKPRGYFLFIFLCIFVAAVVLFYSVLFVFIYSVAQANLLPEFWGVGHHVSLVKGLTSLSFFV